MNMPPVNLEYVRFETRQDRPRFISQRFAQAFDGTVLDVGCDRAVLRDFVPAGQYTGIDRSPEADVHHDLQSGGPLPFADHSFDLVVCTDVLEHLDNLHEVFGEILRVSRKRILISLPNNWNAARRRLERGFGSFKHYGLPLDQPDDRHRWFFSCDEAMAFLTGQGERHGLRIREMLVLEKPRSILLRTLRRVRYPRRNRYWNRYTHTIVCLYEC